MVQTSISQKIIFIYNANSDKGSQLLDFAHKIMSPATYDCQLCSLTFGKFTENSRWKDFRKDLVAKGYKPSFLHKDEFKKDYKSKFGHAFTFPIILLETEYDLEVMVTTAQLNDLKTTQELIGVVKASLGI